MELESSDGTHLGISVDCEAAVDASGAALLVPHEGASDDVAPAARGIDEFDFDEAGGWGGGRWGG